MATSDPGVEERVRAAAQQIDAGLRSAGVFYTCGAFIDSDWLRGNPNAAAVTVWAETSSTPARRAYSRLDEAQILDDTRSLDDLVYGAAVDLFLRLLNARKRPGVTGR